MTTIFGAIIGGLIFFYGLLTLFLKRSILFGGNKNLFTDESIKLFALLSGISEIVVGLGIAIYNVSYFMNISYFIRCIFLAIVWIALTVTCAFYLIVLVKKHN